MADSIIQTEKECYFCGIRAGLEEHHIMAGMANRQISEDYGLKVWLCHRHHTGDMGAQYDRGLNLQLMELAQKKFEELHGHELWMQLFRKNYLTEEKDNE